MVNLSLLSRNIGVIFRTILESQRLLKYIYYTDKDPQSMPDLTTDQVNSLKMTKILPLPFNPEMTEEETIQLRFFFPNGLIQDGNIYADSKVVFEIVVPHSYWLTYEGNQDTVRAYEMMTEVVKLFGNKSIGTLGKLNFDYWHYFSANDKYGLIRLEASMGTF